MNQDEADDANNIKDNPSQDNDSDSSFEEWWNDNIIRRLMKGKKLDATKQNLDKPDAKTDKSDADAADKSHDNTPDAKPYDTIDADAATDDGWHDAGNRQRKTLEIKGLVA